MRVVPNSDRRLRGLERAVASGGGVEDHARLLIERVRAGHLPELRLVFASEYSEGARVAREQLGIPRWAFLTHEQALGPGFEWGTRYKLFTSDQMSQHFDQLGAVRGYVISTNDGTLGGEYYRIEPAGAWYEEGFLQDAKALAAEYEQLAPPFSLAQSLAQAEQRGSLDAAMATRFLDAGGSTRIAGTGDVDHRIAWWQVRSDAFHGDLHATRVITFLKHVWEQTLGLAGDDVRQQITAEAERSEYLNVLCPVQTMINFGDAGWDIGSTPRHYEWHSDVDRIQRVWEAKLAAVILGEAPYPPQRDLLPRP